MSLVHEPGTQTLPIIPTHWLIWLLALSGLIVAALMRREGLVINPAGIGFEAIAATILALFGIRHLVRDRTGRTETFLKHFCEDTLLFMGIVLLGVVASYPAASTSSGFVDPVLARADRLLHFDWLAWYVTVSAYPLLQRLGMAAYAMIFVSPAILLSYFAFAGKRAEARRFLFTFWLAAVLTLLVFPLIPAKGPLAFLWHGRIPYMPTSGLYQEQLIPVLRRHALHDIDLGALRGLVCAPSFHTVSAVIYIATAWPIARLRWLLIPMNLAMLLSTPVEGTHYLTDMIAGGTVAIFAILLVRVILHLVARLGTEPSPAPALSAMS